MFEISSKFLNLISKESASCFFFSYLEEICFTYASNILSLSLNVLISLLASANCYSRTKLSFIMFESTVA